MLVSDVEVQRILGGCGIFLDYQIGVAIGIALAYTGGRLSKVRA